MAKNNEVLPTPHSPLPPTPTPTSTNKNEQFASKTKLEKFDEFVKGKLFFVLSLLCTLAATITSAVAKTVAPTNYGATVFFVTVYYIFELLFIIEFVMRIISGRIVGFVYDHGVCWTNMFDFVITAADIGVTITMTVFWPSTGRLNYGFGSFITLRVLIVMMYLPSKHKRVITFAIRFAIDYYRHAKGHLFHCARVCVWCHFCVWICHCIGGHVFTRYYCLE